MRKLNKATAHQSASPTVVMMDGRGRLAVMTYGENCHTASYLLLNILFGGLPARLGADVDGTRLALAIVWYPVDRLQEMKKRDT